VTPRPPDEQLLHDRVISAIHAALRKRGRIAQTNPGPLRMMAVDGLYPDLVLTMIHERTDIVEAIYEVETVSTVEEKHAKDEWVPFAGLGLMFYLVVPAERLDHAKRIVGDLGIDVKLVGYVEGEDGVITFDQEIEPPM
jgi:hypothetical protein